jgi:hypothetical protein
MRMYRVLLLALAVAAFVAHVKGFSPNGFSTGS